MSEAQSQPIFKIWCFILGLALLLTGLFYLIGGGKLISLGGSWYFLIAGLVTTISAIFIFRKKALGVWIFSLVLFAIAFVILGAQACARPISAFFA